LYSKTEVDTLVIGARNAFNVADTTARNALTGLKVTDRVFVNDDGDTKWALYIVTAVTTGTGSTSTFKKIADEDLFTNALTAAAVKASYESNADTFAFNGTYKGKLDKITVAANVNLDTIKSTADSALANAATAQSTANSASTAASSAQSTANSASTAAAAAQTTANNAATAAATAQSTANAKEDAFTETIETFTALTGAANTAVSVTLAQTPKAGFNIHVFFNGVRVKTTSNTGGSRTLTFTVPYLTEPTDDIVVNYSY
jgi:methyl-accepting chemotaxis protein